MISIRHPRGWPSVGVRKTTPKRDVSLDQLLIDDERVGPILINGL